MRTALGLLYEEREQGNSEDLVWRKAVGLYVMLSTPCLSILLLLPPLSPRAELVFE
jgi:hypothetical protein